MTASNAQAIGNCGKGLETYIYQLLAEKHSIADKELYTNSHMERGTLLEPQAREIYELENGAVVQEVGFIELDEYIGCSPDGLIGEDGGLEIKCKSDEKFFRHLVRGEAELESAYVWQVQMNLLITGRKWWDLVVYNPNFKVSTIVHRILPDKEKHEKLLAGFAEGKKLIQEIESKL